MTTLAEADPPDTRGDLPEAASQAPIFDDKAGIFRTKD
jgi:hypothetical protein